MPGGITLACGDARGSFASVSVTTEGQQSSISGRIFSDSDLF